MTDPVKEAVERLTDDLSRAREDGLVLTDAPNLRALLAENARLKADVDALTKGLTGLTCGGSEFFVRRGDSFIADVDSCVAYVRRVKEDGHRQRVEAIRERNAAAAENARLVKLVEGFDAAKMLKEQDRASLTHKAIKGGGE